MSGFRIEAAQLSQVPALCALERVAVNMFREHAAWHFYASMAIPPDLLYDDVRRGLVWVALVDGSEAPVGFVWLDTEHGGQVAGIAELNVDPDYGRQGIGTALLLHACEQARALGYGRMDLGTLADVAWNAPFYEQHGFRVVDKRDPAFAYARERDRDNGFPEHLRVFMTRDLAPLGAGDWSHWPAPASLRLFSRHARKEDGSTLQQSAIRLLDGGDLIRLRRRDDAQFEISADQPDGLRQVAALLQQHAEVALGADIVLERRVPVAHALAMQPAWQAAVLLGLNHVWQCGLTTLQLAQLAAPLDEEVAVQIAGRSAWLGGGSTHPKPVALAPRWYVVVDTHESVRAAEIIDAVELTPHLPPATISFFASGETLENVFEPIVRARHPQVAAAMNWLESHGHAQLSGSSGAVFLEVATPERAHEIAEDCPAPFTAWVVEGLRSSPLLQTLRRHTAG